MLSFKCRYESEGGVFLLKISMAHDRFTGPQCVSGNACCCLDGTSYCADGYQCECSNCPGESCSCSGCVAAGSGGTCIPNSPNCPRSQCSANQTCCGNGSGETGCCPLPNAVCTGINNECCRSGTVYDPVENHCAVPSNNATCNECIKAAGYLEDKGCEEGCVLAPPGLEQICEILVEFGACEWLLGPNFPLLVCSIYGSCSSGTCDCGYCSEFNFGRCLSFPNHCGSALSARGQPTNSSPPAGWRGKAFQPEVCFDGQCQSGSEGCCLTCL